jgi:hypothetical protein
MSRLIPISPRDEVPFFAGSLHPGSVPAGHETHAGVSNHEDSVEVLACRQNLKGMIEGFIGGEMEVGK